MDKALFNAVDKHVPKINPVIANGLATLEMEHVEAYINNILTAEYSQKGDGGNGLPPGFTYVGLKRLPPLYEYLKTIEGRGANRASFDVARSDFFLVELIFQYEGVEIKKTLYLPFCRDGGLISIRGATFSVVPVLADKGISISKDTVFVRIPKAKIPFKRKLKHHFLKDGERRSPSIAHSWIHNRSRKTDKSAGRIFLKMETTLTHYLLCRYGIKETFKRFLDIDLHIGDEKTITKDTYSPDQWSIFTTMGIVPRAVPNHIPKPTIRFAIRKCDYDNIADSMIGAVYYLIDNFPDRISPEYLDGTENEIYLWRVLLGTIIGGITGGDGAIKRGMDEHMSSLDSYIDPVAKNTLQQGDVYVDDFYELLFHVLEVLSGMASQPVEEAANIYDKQLVVLSYALQDVIASLNSMKYRINNKASKKQLTENDIRTILRTIPKTEVAMNMSGHSEINSISSPGDNKFFKVTSNVVLQTDSGSGAQPNRNKNAGTDSSSFLHASIAEVGSYLVLPKSEPTGRSRLNPFLKLTQDGSVIRNPSHEELIDKTQEKFRRNYVSSTIKDSSDTK